MHDGVQLYKPWAQRGKPLPRTCVEIPERVAGLNVPAVTVNVRHDGEHMLGCDGPFDALLAVAEHVQAAVVDTAYAVQDVLPVCALKKRDVANAKRAVGRFEEHGKNGYMLRPLTLTLTSWPLSTSSRSTDMYSNVSILRMDNTSHYGHYNKNRRHFQ